MRPKLPGSTRPAPKPASKPKPKAPPRVAGSSGRSSGASRSSSGGGKVQSSNWSVDLLHGLGMPVTSENVRFLNAWAQSENTKAAFNPIATTQNAPGATVFNSDGVKNYTSYEQGLKATIQTLQNGRYDGILAALRRGDNALAAAQAQAATPWGTGGLIIKVLEGGGGNTPPSISGVGRRGMSAPVGGANAGMGADATTLDEKSLEAEYGYAAAFFNSDPELKRLIGSAVKEQWTPQRFSAELMGTKWYKTHSASQRQWIQLRTADPDEANKQLQDRRHQIQAMERQSGMWLDDARLMKIAGDSLQFGWNQQDIQVALAAEFHYNPKANYKGTIGDTVASMKQQADQYLVPISDGTMQQWTQAVIRGDYSPDQFSTYLKQQAKSLFPSLSQAIDSGVTVSQYLDPYKQVAAQTLEQSPDSINWLDPKWSQAVFQTDPKTGARGPMSLSQWQTTLRTDSRYGYDRTQGARQDAADLSSKIQQLMGNLG